MGLKQLRPPLDMVTVDLKLEVLTRVIKIVNRSCVYMMLATVAIFSLLLHFIQKRISHGYLLEHLES